MLVTNTALNTKIGDVETKILDVSALVPNIKIWESEKKCSDYNKYVTTQENNKLAT